MKHFHVETLRSARQRGVIGYPKIETEALRERLEETLRLT